MILTLIFLCITILGIILLILDIGCVINDYNLSSLVGGIGAVLAAFGAFVSVVMLAVILVSHVTSDNDIQTKRIEYDGVTKRLEIVDSEFEDVSKSDVIKDITEWNKYVYSAKHWSESKWTNWFWDKEYVDSLEYIEMED